MDSKPYPDTRFKRILYCSDFSESADAAFDFAIDAAVRRPGSTLYILHVVHEPDAQFWRSYLHEVEGVDEQARRVINAKIDETYRARVPAGVSVKVEVHVGPEASTILQFAEEERIDVIILGRRGHGGV